MARRMSVHEARANFSDVLGSVYHTGEPVIIEWRGKPVAVQISPEQYRQLSHGEPEAAAATPGSQAHPTISAVGAAVRHGRSEALRACAPAVGVE
jgi:prevent-host-death family protein